MFPDAAACQDNIQGAREVPEHPLVDQTMRDCLEEAMDLPHLVEYLKRIFAGEIALVARDTPEPSVLCHEILNSEVYTFLDDAPLEERKTRAVYTRRATEARNADDLGALDPAAIERVRAEAWPEANTADELHDALLLAGFIRGEEASPGWRALFDSLVAAGRAHDANGFWVAVERFDELAAVMPQAVEPQIPERLRRTWTREDAARELVRGRLDVLGPVTARELASSLHQDTPLADAALVALEVEGKVLRPRVVNLLCEHSLINAYVDHLRPVPAHLVEEVAREFQLDEIEPTARARLAPTGAQASDTQALLQNLDELLGRLRQSNVVLSSTRERKP